MGVGEHQRFEEACEDYMTWYDSTIQALQELHNSSGSKDDIENRLIKLKVILTATFFFWKKDKNITELFRERKDVGYYEPKI